MHLLLFGCSLISKSNRRAVSSLVKPSKMHQIPSKNIKIYLFLSVLVDFTRLCSALRYRRATEEQPKSSKNIMFYLKIKSTWACNRTLRDFRWGSVPKHEISEIPQSLRVRLAVDSDTVGINWIKFWVESWVKNPIEEAPPQTMYPCLVPLL